VAFLRLPSAYPTPMLCNVYFSLAENKESAESFFFIYILAESAEIAEIFLSDDNHITIALFRTKV
jgi:hypothetical protein